MSLKPTFYLTPEASDNYIWNHQVLILIPNTFKITLNEKTGNPILNTMVLFSGIEKGTNSSLVQPSDDTFLDALFKISSRAGIIGIFVTQSPPTIKFAGENGNFTTGHSEDGLLSVMLDRFLHGDKFNRNNPDNALYAIMARAAIKCVDAAERFIKKHPVLKPAGHWSQIHDKIRYIPVGLSKRGWTSWLVGAVDDRVQAITPIVMSMLNIQKHLHRINRIYNNYWPFSFYPLRKANILGHLDDQGFSDLMNIIDPFAFDYGDKFIAMFSATNDQFFVPDFWGM